MLDSSRTSEVLAGRVVRATEANVVAWTRFRKGYRIHLIVGTLLFLVFCLYGVVALIGRANWGWTTEQIQHWSWLAYASALASTLFSATTIVPGGGRRRLAVSPGDPVLVAEPDGLRIPAADNLLVPWADTHVTIGVNPSWRGSSGVVQVRGANNQVVIPLDALDREPEHFREFFVDGSGGVCQPLLRNKVNAGKPLTQRHS